MTNIELSILAFAFIATFLAIIALGKTIRLREEMLERLRETASSESYSRASARYWKLDAKFDTLQAHLGVRIEEEPSAYVVRLIPPK